MQQQERIYLDTISHVESSMGFFAQRAATRRPAPGHVGATQPPPLASSQHFAKGDGGSEDVYFAGAGAGAGARPPTPRLQLPPGGSHRGPSLPPERFGADGDQRKGAAKFLRTDDVYC